MTEAIVRIAARGEGVTASGRHVAFGVPGDMFGEDGSITPGAGHQQPPCRHFPECGGCQLQHVSDGAYRDYLRDRITGALAQHGLQAEVRDPYLSPPRTRRRAALRALKLGKGVALGFNAAKSNQIVDMRECHILAPELFTLVAPLRGLAATMLRPKRTAEVQLTLVDQGVDIALKGVEAAGLEVAEALTAFCEANRLARLTIDEGLGPETRYEPVPATVTLSGLALPFPPGAFLQATRDGEEALVAGVREAVAGADTVADLFAGLGTFALALEGRVYAAEASRDVVLSLKGASALAERLIAVEHRDLYRRPLTVKELGNFGAVVLDPPRAGAVEQIAQLAPSGVPMIAYVSCNPATFARDAEALAAGGYRLNWVQPVGQFRWSTHVELVSQFVR